MSFGLDDREKEEKEGLSWTCDRGGSYRKHMDQLEVSHSHMKTTIRGEDKYSNTQISLKNIQKTPKNKTKQYRETLKSQHNEKTSIKRQTYSFASQMRSWRNEMVKKTCKLV